MDGRLAADGFPCPEEPDYLRRLSEAVMENRALLIRGRQAALGAAVFSPDSGKIDFFAVHPQYRGLGAEILLLRRLAELCRAPLSLTTFRARDRADPGHRAALLAIGFTEADLLVEFGYPTQRMVLPEGVSL